jgi:tetratricopeptide (TPR) repeat protein
MTGRRCLHALTAAVVALAGLVLGCHLWARHHYRAAERALARRDAAAARGHAARCLQVWFWDADSHLLAARAARLAGDYDQTEACLRDCRRLGGDGGALDLEWKLLDAQRGELRRVEGYLFGLVVKGHPDSARILEVLTRAYYANFQLASALECVKRWLAYEPDSAEPWLWQAHVYEKYLNQSETINSYRRVVELDPANDGARLALASELAAGNEPQEALRHFEYLRPRLGDVTDVLAGMARCRRQLNQPDEARALLAQALAREPDNAQLLSQRGRLALEYESAAEAEKWLRRAAELMPFEKDINYSLYLCLQRLGNGAEAREVLGRLKRTEADLDRMKDLTHRIARAPHDPALRCEAGKLMIRNGHAAEGVRWLHSALREDPWHAATREALADYFERAGDRVQAEAYRGPPEPGGPVPPARPAAPP